MRAGPGGACRAKRNGKKAAAWDPVKGVCAAFPLGECRVEPELRQPRSSAPGARGANAYPDGRSAYGCLQMLGDGLGMDRHLVRPLSRLREFPVQRVF